MAGFWREPPPGSQAAVFSRVLTLASPLLRTLTPSDEDHPSPRPLQPLPWSTHSRTEGQSFDV